MKRTLVYIAPHLSTGGLPQYLFKQIESTIEDFNVYCIEWENVTGGVLVIQRNRIQRILGEKLITLPENKEELFKVLESLKPDVIHLQEIPELFMPSHIASKLYAPNRKYSLIETSHDSSFDTRNKLFFPDKFLMVSRYQINQYRTLGITCDLVEYPIDEKPRKKTREQALRSLGLDPNLKHVINVGLFTPRKNQAEVIEYARALKNYPIQFHFLGNHADNFKYYWEPLMKNLPSNCKWWNERDDVDAFYEAADLFLFTSRGHASDKETMPLVIREAIGWKVPSLIYNLPVYLNYFDKYSNIEYLSENTSENAEKILNKLMVTREASDEKQKECIVIMTYLRTKRSEELTKNLINKLKVHNLPIILTSHTPIPVEIQRMVDYCVYDEKNILTSVSHINTYWRNDDLVSVNLLLNTENNNISYHGPAAYTDIYNGISFANKLGFSVAQCFAYDMVPINDNCVIDASTALRTKKAFMNHMGASNTKVTNEDVSTLRTDWLVIDTDFFLENFPPVLSEKDYSDWADKSGAGCNGLENMWYSTLKDKLGEITLLTDEELKSYFDVTTYNTNSEISSVLPIEGDPTRCVFYIATNFGQDERLFKLYINDKLIHTARMPQSWYYKVLNLSEVKTIKTELWHIDDNVLSSTKTFTIDEAYIANNLKKNGMFTFKTELPAYEASPIQPPINVPEEIFYTMNGKETLTNIPYTNSAEETTNKYGDAAGQYFATFIQKELELQNKLTIEKGDVFVDLGANIGMSSRYALNKGAEPHCFEPDIKMVEILKKNVPNVKIFPYAISATPSELELYHWPHNHVVGGPTYKIQSVTLRQVLALVGKPIDYLKIDIEGHEEDLFDNMTADECSRIDKLMIEHHNNETVHTFCNTLTRLGFDIKHVAGGFQSFIYARNKNFNRKLMTQKTDFGFNSNWDLREQKIHYSAQTLIDFPTIVALREYKSDAILWAVDSDRIEANTEYWIIPIPKHVFSYEDDPYFTGIKICIYNKETGEQLYEKPFFHKFVNLPTVSLSNFLPYRLNYMEFFVEKLYSKWIDKQHKLVVDIGANAGIFTEYMLRNEFAQRIVAVECDSKALVDLKRNFKTNPLVTVIPKALAPTNEPIVFYEFSRNPLVSTTLSPEVIKNHGSGLTSDNITTVETVTLKDIVSTYGAIDLLKIDIEGAEYDIILKAEDSIFDSVKSLFIECHFFDADNYEQNYKGMLSRLTSLGYTVEEDKPNQIEYVSVTKRYSESIYAYKK